MIAGRRLLLAASTILVAGGAVLVLVLALPRGGAAPAAATPVETPPAPAPAVAPATAPAVPPTAPARRLRMPDGTEVEPLNGVKAPAAIVWGDQPYSPIVGTERGNGIDWYVHADGTRTTTLEIWRSDLGRVDPLTLVSHPKAPVLVETGAGRTPAVGNGRKQ